MIRRSCARPAARSIKLKKKEYHAILNLCDSPELALAGKQIFNDMLDAGHAPQEQSYIFLVRVCSLMGEPDEAFGVVRRMASSNVPPRLRSYTPILDAYAAQDRLEPYIAAWAHMEEEMGVAPGDAQIRQAAELLARCGGAAAAPGALGWIEDRLRSYSRHALHLEPRTLRALRGIARRAEAFTPDGRVQECPACGAVIPRRRLDGGERRRMLEGLLDIARGTGSGSGEQDLLFFRSWLRKHAAADRGGAYDVIIDAANVAYSRPQAPQAEPPERRAAEGGAGAAGGAGAGAGAEEGEAGGAEGQRPVGFTFAQIALAYDWCVGRGLRPLVVLGNKYSKATFTTGILRRGGSGSRRRRLAQRQMVQRDGAPGTAAGKVKSMATSAFASASSALPVTVIPSCPSPASSPTS